MKQRTIRNARIVAGDEEFTGCVVIENGLIKSVDQGDSSALGAEDWGGDWLMPGLWNYTPTTWRNICHHAPACCGMRTPP